MASAMAELNDLGWHTGELAMHRAMGAPTHENPSWPTLNPNTSYCLQTSPVFAAGAVDRRGRPWTSVWGGEDGFAVPVRMQQGGETVSGVAVRTLVDAQWDPVVAILREGLEGADEAPPAEGKKAAVGRGVRMSGVPIDLMNRNRAKLAGSVIGAVLEEHAEAKGVADMQVVLKVESSLGNCPKYLNKIPLRPTVPSPALVASSADGASLPEQAHALLSAAPLFFLTTSHAGSSLSTNHRGGPPGFLRVAPAHTSPFADSSNPVLVYPEYSGNRLYQSLGNLHETPLMGIAVPDFRTGTVFLATCAGKMLMGRDAARAMPRTNLAVALELVEWRLVAGALAVVATRDVAASDPAWAAAVGWSPYNPPVRPLAAELAHGNPARLPTPPPDAEAAGTATLTDRVDLAPGIARFAFDLAFPRPAADELWRAGQFVVLDFAPELGHGYRHMDDADPAGLNDDLLRTFTVSSPPAPGNPSLEITIRDVGRATHHLFRANVRAGLELPVRAFGGDFTVPEGATTLGFVAGGIGVTPLLAQMAGMARAARQVRVWWGVRGAEVGFVHGVVGQWAKAEGVKVHLFVKGEADEAGEKKIAELEGMGVKVDRRRLGKEDFEGDLASDVETFYVCAGKGMSGAVQTWLADRGKTVVTESFDF